MYFFLASVRKDLRRILADLGTMTMWLGIPVVIGALMHLGMGGGGGPKPQAHLWVADEDDSLPSALLVGAASQGGDDGLVRLEQTTRAEGLAALEDGEGSALLVIPEGFGAGLLAEDPLTLELFTNPAQRILPGILEEGLRLAVDAAFYAQRLLGEPLREMVAGPPNGSSFFADAEVARISIEINDRMESLAGVLFPPVIELATHVEVEEDEVASGGFGALFLPGLIFMSLLFMCLGQSVDLWQEVGAGTLRRVATAPVSLHSFVAAKAAAGAFVMLAVVAVALGVGVALYDFPLRRAPAAAAWCVFSGLTFLFLFLALQSLATSARGGGILTTAVLFPLLMLGGSFFPFEAMPAWMQSVGRWTPNGMAVIELKRLLFGGVEPLALGGTMLAMAATAAACFFFLVRRVRDRFIGG